ncbi:MAG: phosphatase PAP2 family protein [Dermatophilaceae bacterium]
MSRTLPLPAASGPDMPGSRASSSGSRGGGYERFEHSEFTEQMKDEHHEQMTPKQVKHERMTHERDRPEAYASVPFAGGRRPRPGVAITFGLLLVAMATGGVWLLVRALVQTERGQRAEDLVTEAIVTDWRTDAVLLKSLQVVSITAVALAVVLLAAIGMARRRPDLAVASAALVVVANVTTQVVKYGLVQRPDFGYFDVNTLPSGHVTVITSIIVGLLLVLPATWRPVLVPLGTLVGTTAGVATVVLGWHNPSDVAAAYLVVMGSTGLVVAGMAAGGRMGARAPRRAAGRAIGYGLGASVASALLGLALLVGGLTHAGGRQHLVAGAIGLGAMALACAFGICAATVAIDLLGDRRQCVAGGRG